MDYKRKLNVDDLIIEYMIYMVKNGYDISFNGNDFIDFLHYFESKMEVEVFSYNIKELFDGFVQRKYTYAYVNDDKVNSHMDIIYNSDMSDCFVKANYKLSDFDMSIINTYFMDTTRVKRIREIMGEYLKDKPKREINMSTYLEKENLLVGKCVSAEIIFNIWNSYVRKNVENHVWPRQCNDIDKYLLEFDLATVIGLDSNRDALLELYSKLSKRIGIMYQEDRNLKINSSNSFYLANANYKLLTNEYEQLVGYAFGEFKSSLEVDFSSLLFTESHRVGGIYFWDEDVEIKSTTEKINNNKTKKLVMNMDKYV